MYKGGYAGKILRINLTERSVKDERLSPESARNFIGGAGLGIKYLFDELSPCIDPLGPENKLIFTVGPLTGTLTPGASRMVVSGKSPLTHAVGMALSGGHFPAELTFCGIDALIIEGKAEHPTYLWINNGRVIFKDARKLWGTKTTDCQTLIQKDLKNPAVRVAAIGPAGENQCRIACIINEMRAAGRRGLGAVMGSKNLKAIAIKGEESVPIASKDKYRDALKQMKTMMKASPALYTRVPKNGTIGAVDGTCLKGIFPAKNWRATGEFAPVESLGTEAQALQRVGNERCYLCPVGCSQVKLAKSYPYTGILSEGPEFETVYSFGGQTGVDNLDSIIAADRLCDELGLDTISAGVTIGFAMELFEKGVLKPADTDGLTLDFGNHEAMIELVKRMAFREGFGDVLADGSRIAAERIGGDTARYAMHVKGLELPGYDVRGAFAHGLNYATAYTGADHNRGYAFQEIQGVPIPYAVDPTTVEGKGKLTKRNQDVVTATCDCPPLCVFIMQAGFPGKALEHTAAILEGVTGFDYTESEIERIGERVVNLARAFNVREGLTRKDDTLPLRLMTEPLKAGPLKGHCISQDQLDAMLDEYYKARDWDVKTGIPTQKKLEALDIGYAAKHLSAT